MLEEIDQGRFVGGIMVDKVLTMRHQEIVDHTRYTGSLPAEQDQTQDQLKIAKNHLNRIKSKTKNQFN